MLSLNLRTREAVSASHLKPCSPTLIPVTGWSRLTREAVSASPPKPPLPAFAWEAICRITIASCT